MSHFATLFCPLITTFMHNPDHPPLILLAGPTATGKTALAVALAKRLNAEIVNADSMQVYRGCIIGTAQPTPEELGKIPCHLINFVPPHRSWTVADWLDLAWKAIRNARNAERPVIVTGGTGLYFKALTDGLFETKDAGRHPELRERLTREWQADNGQTLRKRLEQIDPRAANRIHPNDCVRTIRALEVFEATGQPLTSLQDKQKSRHRRPQSARFVLCAGRAPLYKRIDRRVLEMVEKGFENEVRQLETAGARPEWPAMRALGYPQMLDAIHGRITRKEAIAQTQQISRRYAKQQIVLYRKWGGAVWLDAEQGVETSIRTIEKTLEICPCGWF